MRRLVFHTLALILAMNGIACACPAGPSGDSELSHVQHSQHADMQSHDRVVASADEFQECCDSCESPDAVKRLSEKLSTNNLSAQPFDLEMDAISSNVMVQAWHSKATNHSPHSTLTLPHPRQSPVFLFDLMLD